MKKRKSARAWDLGAVTLSSACMLHCLGLPLFTAMLPVASLFGDSEVVHLIMVLLALPVTAWVVLSEITGKRNGLFIAAACIGIGLMLAAVIVPALEAFETPITLVGGSLLAGAHLWRWCQHHSRFPALNDNV